MKENTYTLFWLDGKAELVKGKTSQEAFKKAGYGSGAVKALDFMTDGDQKNKYTWDGRRWKKKENHED